MESNDTNSYQIMENENENPLTSLTDLTQNKSTGPFNTMISFHKFGYLK